MNERSKREDGAGTDEHVRERIHACLDGELPKDEEARVRAHCRSCAECGRAWTDAEALVRLLAEDRASEPIRPIWPEVRDRRGRRIVGPAPIRIGAALAVAAGIFLGLFFPMAEGTSPASQEGTWSEVGTSLSDAGGGGLADMYLLALVDDGENTQ